MFKFTYEMYEDGKLVEKEGESIDLSHTVLSLLSQYGNLLKSVEIWREEDGSSQSYFCTAYKRPRWLDE